MGSAPLVHGGHRGSGTLAGWQAFLQEGDLSHRAKHTLTHTQTRAHTCTPHSKRQPEPKNTAHGPPRHSRTRAPAPPQLTPNSRIPSASWLQLLGCRVPRQTCPPLYWLLFLPYKHSGQKHRAVPAHGFAPVREARCGGLACSPSLPSSLWPVLVWGGSGGRRGDPSIAFPCQAALQIFMVLHLRKPACVTRPGGPVCGCPKSGCSRETFTLISRTAVC